MFLGTQEVCVARLSLDSSIPRIVKVKLLQQPISSHNRTVQVNVKTTEEDFRFLKKASEKRWPDMVMTNSGIV